MIRIAVFVIAAMLTAVSAYSGSKETYKKEIPLGKAEMVRVDMDLSVAKLEVIPGSSRTLLKALVEYDPDKFKPLIDYSDGKTGYLDIVSKKRGSVNLRDLSDEVNDWELEFSPKVPLEIDLELGLGEGFLDFSGLRIADLSVDAGLSELEMQFNKPNPERLSRLKIESGLGQFTADGLLNANCEELDFSGGLGSSKLYFTGDNDQPIEAKIEVGLGSIVVLIQEGVPTRINTEGSIFSSVDVEGFQKVRKGEYISRNWDEDARNRLEIEIEVGMGAASVEWTE